LLSFGLVRLSAYEASGIERAWPVVHALSAKEGACV
jgi:hypothetical protein